VKFRRTRGVTLIEIVVVIVLLSILLGLSVALFRSANRDLGVRASSHHLVALLRAAHEQSRASRNPSWVVIHVGDRSVYGVSRETVGEWHFETLVAEPGGARTPGAFGKDGRVTNAQARLVPGRVGLALEFLGRTTVDCGEWPIQAEDQGITIDFWYFPADVSAGGLPPRQTLCTVGSQVEIGVEPNGRLTATIGEMALNTGDVLLKHRDRWYRILLVYDGREACLWVNDTLLATKPGKIRWNKTQRIGLGATKHNCVGLLDEFRVGIVLPREKYVLAGQAAFELPHGYLARDAKEFVIHFDSEGRLDPRKHAQALRIKIKSPTDEKEITLLPTGAVQR